MQRNANFAGVPLRNLPEDMMLSKNKIARILKMSPSTVTRLVALDGFPDPIQVGRFPAYRAGAVSKYLDSVGGVTV